jgi:Peptidase family M1 domain
MGIVLTLLIGLLVPAAQDAKPADADEILMQLSNVRLDKKQIHSVRDITLRRDVLSITLNRGLIAFLEPVMGKVTGAVFIGSGEIVAIPPDTIEKQQIYKFTGTPILNETFQTAIFRFTDKTYDEVTKEISQHAEEEISPDEAAQFDPWDAAVADRARLFNNRLLADFLEPVNRPVFLGELKGDKAGWFDVVLDFRSDEEVSAFQVQNVGGSAFVDIWANFNQRSESRNREAVAHEDKTPTQILAHEVEPAISPENKLQINTTLRVVGREDGTRILNLDLPPSLRVSSITSKADAAVAFYQLPATSGVTVVLAVPLNSGQELTLRLTDSAMPDTVRTVREEEGPAEMKTFFAGILGPYPNPRLTVLQSTQDRSQSLPMLIELPSNPDSGALQLIMAQEIARQWIGHNMTPASYHDGWLFESLPRYLGAMYMDRNNSSGSTVRQILDDAREQLKPIEGSGAIWLGQRLVSTKSPAGHRAMYLKGVWVMHMLRMMLRRDDPDPDAEFRMLLREIVATYSGKSLSTFDFKHAIEKHMTSAMDVRGDKKMDWFFDNWVFGMGVPRYAVAFKASAIENGFTVEGTIKQTDVPEDFAMPLPVYADDQYLGRVTVAETEGEFRFRTTQKPERVVIDPERTVLTATPQ